MYYIVVLCFISLIFILITIKNNMDMLLIDRKSTFLRSNNLNENIYPAFHFTYGNNIIEKCNIPINYDKETTLHFISSNLLHEVPFKHTTASIILNLMLSDKVGCELANLILHLLCLLGFLYLLLYQATI